MIGQTWFEIPPQDDTFVDWSWEEDVVLDPSDAVDLVGVPIDAERSSHPERPFLVSFKDRDGVAGSVQNSLAPAVSKQV